MRPRFLAAVAEDVSSLRNAREVLRGIARRTKGRIVLEEGPAVVLAIGDPVRPLGPDGVLIGPMFKGGAAADLTADDKGAALRTAGASLICSCWGGYAALILDRQTGCMHLVRAPLGDLSCYWSVARGVLLIASDLALLLEAGLPSPAIDVLSLIRHLTAEDLRRSDTCLSGVHELRGGDRLSIRRGTAVRETLWSPWMFAAAGEFISDPDEAAHRVRGAVVECVGARAAEFNQILLKLSGGLDSSIVAAALREIQQPFIALTLATDDPAGDERSHAALVAEAVGAPLIERFRDASRVSLDRSVAADLPRPTARSFTQESSRIAAQAATARDCDAIFDGGGGDNIFCSLQSARPAADCLMSATGHGRFWATSAAISQLAQASIWTVVRRGWAIRMRRAPTFAWGLDTRFLSTEAKADLTGEAPHPWLVAPGGSLPGKAAHVALIAAAQSVAEGFDPREGLPTCSPLISQPIVETCLQVPTWLWFESGHNRAVARRAFRPLLPSATVQRRSKGAPDCFIADLYDANRGLIRRLLMDGVLRQLGLLDVAALEKQLDEDAPVRGHDFLRIMQLTDAEAWARCWS